MRLRKAFPNNSSANIKLLKTGGFRGLLLGTLGASLLGNLLTGKGVMTTGEGTIKAGEGTIRGDQNF